MAIDPGDRVELVATNDPYTDLRPGDRGTLTGVHGFPEPAINVQWDGGSTLSILPDAGDRIRKLTGDHHTDDADPAPGSPAATPTHATTTARQTPIPADPSGDPDASLEARHTSAIAPPRHEPALRTSQAGNRDASHTRRR
jgi:hypothetical protein